MQRDQATLARLRPVAGSLLLALFLAAAQLAPAVHLATHRDDHTHGPELPSPFDRDADSDHDHLDDHDDADLDDHDHDDLDHHDGGALDALDHDHGGAAEHHDHDGAPAPHRHSSEHGQSSAAHFGLALLQGPPALFLPLPPDTLAPPPDAVLHGRVAAPRPQPPARGPPSLT